MSHGEEFGFYAEGTGQPKRGLEELRKVLRVQGVGKREEDGRRSSRETEVRRQDGRMGVGSV